VLTLATSSNQVLCRPHGGSQKTWQTTFRHFSAASTFRVKKGSATPGCTSGQYSTGTERV
jgi:hypothetical protein